MFSKYFKPCKYRSWLSQTDFLQPTLWPRTTNTFVFSVKKPEVDHFLYKAYWENHALREPCQKSAQRISIQISRPELFNTHCVVHFYTSLSQDCTSIILAPQTSSIKWPVNSCLAGSQNMKYLSISNMWLSEWTLSGYENSSGFLITIAKTS